MYLQLRRSKSRRGDPTRAMMHGRKAPIKAAGKTTALVVSTTANPGLGVIAFRPSSIWDAAKDLAGRAWDEINEFLTDEGGGGGGGLRDSEPGPGRNRHSGPGAGTVQTAILNTPLRLRLDPAKGTKCGSLASACTWPNGDDQGANLDDAILASFGSRSALQGRALRPYRGAGSAGRSGRSALTTCRAPRP